MQLHVAVTIYQGVLYLAEIGLWLFNLDEFLS